MVHKRNTLGLKNAAQLRRENTIKRVNAAVKLLVKENRVINFNSVAKVANVGKTWLYKENDIRERILGLRISSQNQMQNMTQVTNSASKDALIKMLKQRVKELEKDNRNLKRQVEILYGELHNAAELKMRTE